MAIESPRNWRFVLFGLAIAGCAPALAQPTDWQPADPYGDATVTREDARTLAEQRFAAMDTDHDGFLSVDERAAARPARGPDGGGNPARAAGQRRHSGWGGGRGGGRGMDGLADADGRITRPVFIEAQLRRFDMADADHDGKLTKEERDAAREMMRARMDERMRDMPMPPPMDLDEGPGGADQN